MTSEGTFPIACILLLTCMYPPPHMHISSSSHACILLLTCMYPPPHMHVSSSSYAWVVTVPIGAKHQEPKHPFGLPGVQAALLSHHVRPSGTHQSLSVPARNRASARALPNLSMHKLSLHHELCPWGESSKLDRSHWSQTPRAKTPIRAATGQTCSAAMCQKRRDFDSALSIRSSIIFG
jgi:hypothetical protein